VKGEKSEEVVSQSIGNAPDGAHLAHTGAVRPHNRRALAGLVIGYGIAGAVAALFLFSRLVVRATGLPPIALAVAWAIVLAAGLLALAWWGLRRLWANRRMPPSQIRSDEGFRVRCIAPNARLDALRRLGPIDDNPFEPQEFPGFLVLRPSGTIIAAWVAISVSVGVLTLVLSPGIPTGLYIFIFYGAFASGGIAVTLLWPTTIRVVPGRIDIVRRLVFRPERPERKTITLRTAAVLVDLRRWYTHIEGPTPETSLVLWLWPIRGRMELAHAILMGAVSSARPGPVGDDPEGLRAI